MTVWLRPNGLPIAMTQSPGCICSESPNLASCSGAAGISVSWISALSVSGVAADHLGRVALGAAAAEQADADVLGLLDDVVVREDEAGLVDDEAGAGARLQRAVLVVRIPWQLASARRAPALALTLSGRRPWPKKRRSRSSPPSESVRSRFGRRAEVGC